MFKIISSISVLLFLCIKVNATVAPLFDREIIRINENMHVGKKQLPFKNSDGTVNTEGDDVYFVFEKLTDKNFDFWENYNHIQDLKSKREGAIADVGVGNTRTKKTVTVIDGISSFLYSLKLKGKLNSDIWITYATRKNPVDGMQINEGDIEMAFSVFLNEVAPITTHMGISRGYDYFKYSMRPHLGLAMELHAFAANVSNKIYSTKSYIVTKPAREMREIMLQSFKKNDLLNYIWTGDTQERKEKQDFIKNIQRNIELFETFKNNSAEISIDEFWFEYEYERISLKNDLLNLSEAAKEGEAYLS